MNAVNPAPSAPTGNSDQRHYEPSMEEILASIRRIIADDQMLPARSDARDLQAASDQIRAPVQVDQGPPDPPATPLVPTIREYPTSPFYEDDRVAAKGSAAIEAQTLLQGQVSAQQAVTLDTPVPAPPPVYPLRAASPEAVIEPARETKRPTIAAIKADFDADLADPPPEAAHAYEAPGATMREPVDDSPPAIHRIEATEFEQETDAVDPYFDPPIERDEPLPMAETPAALFSTHTKQAVSSAFNMLAATRLADNSEELLGLAREMIRPLLKTWLDDNLPSMVERLVRAEIERVARGGR